MYNKITTVTNNSISMINKTEDEKLIILLNPANNYSEVTEIVKEYIKLAWCRTS